MPNQDLSVATSDDSQDLKPSDYVISIVLSDSMVQTLLVGIGDFGIKVISSSRAVAYTDSKQCVIQVDECLQQLGKDSESVNKVVFVLGSNWIKDGEVASPHKALLEQITKELGLEPVGFVDEAEALSQFYLAQNPVFSGVFVVVGLTGLNLSYISQGKQKGQQSVGRSSDFKADVTEGLARFSQLVEETSGYLPATLYLVSFDLSETELREHQQNLLGSDWHANVRFLQAPIVQVITDEQYTHIVASEAGRAAALIDGKVPAAVLGTAGPLVQAQAQLHDQSEQIADAESFGFSNFEEAKEIKRQPIPEISESPESPVDSETAVPEVEPKPEMPIATSFGIPIKPEIPSTADENDEDDLEPSQNADLGKKGLFGGLIAAWKKPYQGKRGKLFFAVTGLTAGLLVVGLIMLVYAYSTATATVNIIVERRPISKDAKIVVDSSATASEPENLVLAASTTDVFVSDKGSIPTTGIKIVGDKASGVVTIFNKTTSQKTFAAGTVLKSSDLEFTLDEEIKVASASVQEKSGGAETKYGKVDAKVTANEIGADYNLSGSTKLSIASFASDTYEAEVSKDGLSGGASREVRVVAEEDTTALLSELKSSLIEAANKKLSDEAASGQYVLPSDHVIEERATFSAQVGEESDVLELNLEIALQALTYSVDDLRPIAQAILSSDIPDGFELSEEEPQILSSPSQSASQSAVVKQEIEAQVSSFAVPKLDESAIKNEVANQSVAAVVEALKSKESVKEVQITFNNFVSSLVNKLPSADRVQIQMSIE